MQPQEQTGRHNWLHTFQQPELYRKYRQNRRRWAGGFTLASVFEPQTGSFRVWISPLQRTQLCSLRQPTLFRPQSLPLHNGNNSTNLPYRIILRATIKQWMGRGEERERSRSNTKCVMYIHKQNCYCSVTWHAKFCGQDPLQKRKYVSKRHRDRWVTWVSCAVQYLDPIQALKHTEMGQVALSSPYTHVCVCGPIKSF